MNFGNQPASEVGLTNFYPSLSVPIQFPAAQDLQVSERKQLYGLGQDDKVLS